MEGSVPFEADFLALSASKASFRAGTSGHPGLPIIRPPVEAYAAAHDNARVPIAGRLNIGKGRVRSCGRNGHCQDESRRPRFLGFTLCRRMRCLDVLGPLRQEVGGWDVLPVEPPPFGFCPGKS